MDARTEPQPMDRYQVGDLLVDPVRQGVSRAGVEIPLPRLSYELLLALVEAHPRMLSNEDLLARVWGRTVVNPETVNQRVKLLRHALGDDAHEPRYIVTVRGRGYRLATGVVALPASQSPPDIQPAPQPSTDAGTGLKQAPRTGASPGRLSLAIALAATAMLAVAVAWYARHDTGSAGTARPPSEAIAAVAAASKAAPEKSIAVLPFVDLSEKKDAGYLVDGLTDEVTAVLAQVGALRVSARTSAYYFKDRAATVAEIGKALGVANVLEGSVRVAGDRIRVTAQLIRADSGYHLWSGSYERGREDLFTVQNEIARAVVAQLKVSLLGEPGQANALSANTQASDLYLQAIVGLNRGTRDDVHNAIARLRRAVELDPHFAQAWAALANTYIATTVYDDAQVARIRPVALEAADHAVASNPELAEAHAARARVLMLGEGDLAAALQEIRQTLDADPNDPGALDLAAQLQVICGRTAESVRLAREAVSRDPLVARYYTGLAEKLWVAGDLPQALQAQRTAIALNPQFPYGNFILAVMQLSAGDPKSALESVDHGGDAEERQLLRPAMLDALGRHAEAEREQAAAERKYAPQAAADLAIYYAARGDADHALPLLEQAFRIQDGGNLKLHINPLFSKLHSDPRFQRLLQEHNVPDPALCRQITGP